MKGGEKEKGVERKEMEKDKGSDHEMEGKEKSGEQEKEKSKEKPKEKDKEKHNEKDKDKGHEKDTHKDKSKEKEKEKDKDKDKDHDNDNLSPPEQQTPKAKQHGKQPTQTVRRKDGQQLQPAANEPAAQNLTKSFAEALKDVVSNGPKKENPNLQNHNSDSDSDQPRRHGGEKGTSIDERQQKRNEMIGEDDIYRGEAGIAEEDVAMSRKYRESKDRMEEQRAREESGKSDKKAATDPPQGEGPLKSKNSLGTDTKRQHGRRPSVSKGHPSTPQQQDSIRPSKPTSTQTPSTESAGDFAVRNRNSSTQGKTEPMTPLPVPDDAGPTKNEKKRHDSGIDLDISFIPASLSQLPHIPPMTATATSSGMEALEHHLREEALRLPLPGDGIKPAGTETKGRAREGEGGAVGISSMTLYYVDQPLTHPSKARNAPNLPVQINLAEGYRLHLKREDLAKMPARIIRWGPPGKEVRIHLNTA
ncbi:hypothetical protein F5Y17DRAFT_386081 [Xylariaceae sp. FL0594]|nr:hypothetical protein F5Y17DRAFT_386081 [Xylariaceae sp. FL0594]